MYNKIHMLKQQAADLIGIINFEATWILNAIKIECSIFEVRFLDFMMHNYVVPVFFLLSRFL